MGDRNKLEASRGQMISDNEKTYGKEIRQRYGDDIVNASYAKVKGMSHEKMQAAETLRVQMEDALKEAFALGDPGSESAHRVCEMHRQWICLFWPDGMYSREAHKGLADLYAADERFRANYDKIAPGCTDFLRDAIYQFCEA